MATLCLSPKLSVSLPFCLKKNRFVSGAISLENPWSSVPVPKTRPCSLTYHRLSVSMAIGNAEILRSEKEKRDVPPHRTRPAVLFGSLGADEFRHPLDRQNTALLQVFPGLKNLGQLLLGPMTEQMMLLENMGTSILVSETQLSRLHDLMQEAATILGMPAPDLYVRQSPLPNAYTLAIAGRRPFVVIHTALVELLTPAELQAVLAHELGHLKCDHGIWLTFANVLALGAYSVPGLGAMIARNLEDQLMRWLRAAELTCDRAALLVAQDPKVVVSVLMKLAGGSPSLAADLNVDAFLQQARSYDEAASSSPLAWYLRNAQTRQLSHPLPVLRAREVDQWSRSREYKALIGSGRREAVSRRITSTS